MCGIVGYIGKRDLLPVLLDSLKRLEYRGYDSAGVAVTCNGRIEIARCEGKIEALRAAVEQKQINGACGIAHTRWATHGRPSETNAHPHVYNGVAVVHNGIIENYLELKEMLIQNGNRFSSETDSEVITHLIVSFMSQGAGFEDALCKTLRMLKGAYAVAALCESEPDRIVAARCESPLIVGLGEDEFFVGSDIPAFLPYTRKVVYLHDREIAVIDPEGVAFKTLEGKPVEKTPAVITWDPVMAEKGGFKHFMLKEIFEQPRAVADTLRGRIVQKDADGFLDNVEISAAQIQQIERICFVACGTSYFAGLVGKFVVEKLCRIPVEVELASEFRYRDPVIDSRSLVVFISQSGETADTLAALKEAKTKDAQLISICNVVGSSLARETGSVLYTHAGPEIGVASTKAFTCQLTAIYLLALFIGRRKNTIPDEAAAGFIQKLTEVPGWIEDVLGLEQQIMDIAEHYSSASDFLYLARGINYPIALEGALKLKEISYIHAEGYPAGEMKHGPIALIDELMPVVVIAPRDRVYQKVLSNIEEVKARKGLVIALAAGDDREAANKADHFIPIPAVDSLFTPFVTVVPLQLFAYHVAVCKGTDVDQPRNLAKSVTVE